MSVLTINWGELETPQESFSDFIDLLTANTKELVDKASNIASAKNNLEYNYYRGLPDKTLTEMNKKDTVFNLQKDLYNNGYLNNTNLDGIIGGKTREAVKNARKDGYTIYKGKLLAPDKESYVPSNSLYALAHRQTIGKIYPYDYNPAVTFDQNNINGFNEFLDLDLSTPEGRLRAEEIRAMKQSDGKPLFSNRRIADNNTLLRQFRERYDLLNINAGQPQKYGSFRKYTGDDGQVFYEFTNLNINKRYTDRAYNTKKRFGVDSNGEVHARKKFDNFDNEVIYQPRDLTNVLFNLYTIKQKNDSLGKTSSVDDTWNLAPTEFLPGNEIAPNISIDRYDDLETNREKGIEDMIVRYSVYDKDGSVRFDSNRIPKYEIYPKPFSYDYVSDVIEETAAPYLEKTISKINLITLPYLNSVSNKTNHLADKAKQVVQPVKINLQNTFKPKIKLRLKIKRFFR